MIFSVVQFFSHLQILSDETLKNMLSLVLYVLPLGEIEVHNSVFSSFAKPAIGQLSVDAIKLKSSWKFSNFNTVTHPYV